MKMPTGRVWIARSGTTPIGLISAIFEGRRGWIWHFGVAPSFRKGELGSALLKLSEDHLSALSAPKVLLMVRHSDQALINHYAKHGYCVDDVTAMGKWHHKIET
jgi:ribosomal protein S18 acetylase RimI-like enzyme